MKVLQYKVRNVLKISEVDFNLKGRNLVLIGGKNASGKSSSLTALLMAVCGKSGTDWPDIVIKEGEDSASVEVDLGDEDDNLEYKIIVTWKKTRSGSVAESFKLVDRDGQKVPEPRKLLKELYKLKGFDPLAFQSAKPKDRLEMLRDLVGIDFTELDAKRKVAFERRTEENREAKRLEGVVSSITAWPSDTPEEPVSASDLMEEMRRAIDANDITRTKSNELSRAERDSTDIANQIKQYEEIIVQMREKKQSVDDNIEDMKEFLLGSPLINTESLQEKISDSDAVNKNVTRKKNSNDTKDELKRVTKAAEVLTDELIGIDQEKKEMLLVAPFPLPGLSMDSEGVLYNGLPFDQASTAERTLISVKMGMATNPKLRLMVSENGNDLDNDTLATLEETLKDGDFQLLLEMVTRNKGDEDRCAVVFFDGIGESNAE